MKKRNFIYWFTNAMTEIISMPIGLGVEYYY